MKARLQNTFTDWLLAIIFLFVLVVAAVFVKLFVHEQPME